MLKFGSNNIGKVLFGSNVIGKAYYGSNLVYSAGSSPTPSPYDARVEYIQTDGSQYIDFGFKSNAATFGLYIDFQQTTVKTQARLMAANQANSPCQMYINGSGKAGYRVGNSWASVDIPAAFGTDRHTWFCDYYNRNNRIDGTDYAMAAAYPGISSSNLFLCGPYTTNNKFVGKIYAAKIYESGVLKVDLIPVRVGTTAYMFDTVSETLFGNAGSGSYGYGNDINNE